MTLQEAIKEIVHYFDLDLNEYDEKRLTGILSSVERVVHKRHVDRRYIYVTTHPSDMPVDLYAESKRISKMYGVTVEKMIGKSRDHDCVGARAHLVREMRMNKKMKYVKLAGFLNRDHSSIIHLCYDSKANCLVKPLPRQKPVCQ